jgi:hypothetical protein
LRWRKEGRGSTLDPGAVGPQTLFYLFRDRHRQRARRPNSELYEASEGDSRRAALMTGVARCQGPEAEPPWSAKPVNVNPSCASHGHAPNRRCPVLPLALITPSSYGAAGSGV